MEVFRCVGAVVAVGLFAAGEGVEGVAGGGLALAVAIVGEDCWEGGGGVGD